MRKRISYLFLLVILCGCRKETPIPLLPEEIILHSIERMNGSSGFHFVIEREGAPAYIDAAGTLSIRRMEGDFVAPDRVRATVRIVVPGIVVEIEAIGIGDTQWETNPLSGEWQQLPPDWGFNPALFFDPDSGLQNVLQTDLKGVELLGNFELEDWPGTSLYKITGILEGDLVNQISYGLIGKDTIDVTLWIAPDNFELYRIVLVDGVQEEETIWTLDIWDYDKVVEIEPPMVDEDK